MGRRNRLSALVASAGLLAVALAGCTSPTGASAIEGSGSYRITAPPITDDHVIVLGEQRLLVQVPAGVPIPSPRSVRIGDCLVVVAVVPTVDGRNVEVSSSRDDCRLGPQKALNGNIGYYRSLDDIGGPSSRQATPVGPASLGSISYTECTNSCVTADVPVAIVRLATPMDPGRTTIQVLERPWQGGGERARADLEAYLSQLGR